MGWDEIQEQLNELPPGILNELATKLANRVRAKYGNDKEVVRLISKIVALTEFQDEVTMEELLRWAVEKEFVTTETINEYIEQASRSWKPKSRIILQEQRRLEREAEKRIEESRQESEAYLRIKITPLEGKTKFADIEKPNPPSPQWFREIMGKVHPSEYSRVWSFLRGYWSLEFLCQTWQEWYHETFG